MYAVGKVGAVSGGHFKQLSAEDREDKLVFGNPDGSPMDPGTFTRLRESREEGWSAPCPLP